MINIDNIVVEVTYATPNKQLIIPVNVPQGSLVRDAIELSGIKKEFPEIKKSKSTAQKELIGLRYKRLILLYNISLFFQR